MAPDVCRNCTLAASLESFQGCSPTLARSQ